MKHSPARPRILHSVALAFVLALCIGCCSLVACAPEPSGSTGTESAVQYENESNELAPLTENIYYQGDAAPVNEPYTEGAAPQTYKQDGSKSDTTSSVPTEVARIIERCTGSCHDAIELETYTATVEEAQIEVDSMVSSVNPILTDEEKQLLVDFYGVG